VFPAQSYASGSREDKQKSTSILTAPGQADTRESLPRTVSPGRVQARRQRGSQPGDLTCQAQFGRGS